MSGVKVPRAPRLPKLPKAPTIFTRGPRGLQAALMGFEHRSGPGEIPEHLAATLPEWYVYWALLKLGKRPGLDFEFQAPLLGGRLAGGGTVADFAFRNPPDLLIFVQGEYWHYQRGSEKIALDKFRRVQLAGYGFTVVMIDESDALANPVYYVSEALAGRDHSRLNEV